MMYHLYLSHIKILNTISGFINQLNDVFGRLKWNIVIALLSYQYNDICVSILRLILARLILAMR